MKRIYIFIISFLAFLSVSVYFFVRNDDAGQNILHANADTTNDTVIDASPVFVMDIEPLLYENSGLVFYRDLFWTFNDSDGENAIFSFDTLHDELLQKFRVESSINIDWEDITQDSAYIYIGDFGNNYGNRKDLAIYRIHKKYITDKSYGTIMADKINFQYEDQQDFTPGLRSTEYDCEAFFSLNDHLYLFTKDWIFEKTKVYKLPKIPGDYTAKYIATLEVNGLITAGDISPDKKTMALLGYKDYTPYLMVFTNFYEDDFFSARKIRFEFSSIYDAQTEGLTFTTSQMLYISSEYATFAAQLYRFDLSKWEDILH